MLKTLAERRIAIEAMNRVALAAHLETVCKDIKTIEELAEQDFGLKAEEYQLLIEEETHGRSRLANLDKAIQLRESRRGQNGDSQQQTNAQLTASGGIGNIRDGWKDDPKLGYTSLSGLLTDVREVFINKPATVDLKPQVKFLLSEGSDAFATYNHPFGGVFVPEAFMPGYATTAAPSDPLAGLVTKFQMAAPVTKMRARVDKDHTDSVTGGLLVTRRAESNPFRDSRFKTEEVKFEASMLAAYAIVTEEQIEDGDTSIISLLNTYFPDEFANRIAHERINGNGAGGEFEGILNCPATIEQAKETGQDAETIVADNVLNMRSRCWGYQNAVWLANPETFTQLAKLYIAAGTTGVVTFYHMSLQDDAPDRLLGRPIFYSEYCNAIGTVGDLLLVNPREYWEGSLKPLQSASSVHVRFDSHERVFKFWQRNAGKSPWRDKLKIKKSKNNAFTLSPFVSLAVRA